MIRIFSKLLLATLVGMIACNACAQDLKLSRVEKVIPLEVAELILHDVYKKAGLEFTAMAMPGARATAVTLTGEKDGEVGRIAAYAEKNPTFIKISPPYYYISTGVFSKGGKGIVIKSKNDLQNFRVGIVRGVAHAAEAVEGISNVQFANDISHLLKLLDTGRIELAVDSTINGLAVARQMSIKDVKLVGEIARQDVFHILAPDKKELAPKLSATIKTMKESGELDKLIKQYESAKIN